MFSLAGWLFADLLLAMATIFIVASAVGVYVPSQKPIPTPSVARVNTVSYRLCLQINDYGDLLNDSPSARNEVVQQIQHDSFLNRPGRRAALVIPYGGAPDQNQEATGLSIADKVVRVLQKLGENQKSVFFKTAFHDSVHYLGQNFGFVELEIYLFAQSDFRKPPNGNCP